MGEPAELSDVSFLSRDRDYLDSAKYLSDESDEEVVVDQRRNRAIVYAMSLQGSQGASKMYTISICNICSRIYMPLNAYMVAWPLRA